MTQQVEQHILQKYTLVKKVGSGAYGHVWKVTDKKSNDVLALKKIFDAFQHSTDAQRTYRQIVFLHELNHPNIIKLYNVIRAENDKDLYLVFQFMEADLHNAIGQKILKDAHNRYILYQLMKGLKFMHSAEVIHRDLKPSNLLLNSDCHLKICDFGLARSLAIDKNDDKDIILTEQVATRWYRAPQVLLGSNYYDKSADIWSVGCILAQMLVGKPVFPGSSTLNQLQKILTFTGRPKHDDIEALNSQTAFTMINEVNVKQRPLNEWFKPGVPQDAIQLVTSMLSINPKKRPTASQVLKHPYLASFHKPKEETVSDKIIHPPISDNKKLNLKQYRRLIYERIKKIYSTQSEVSKPQQEVKIEDVRRSVDRNVGRQPATTQPKSVQKQPIKSYVDEEKVGTIVKNQKVERPISQFYPRRTSSTQGLANNPSVLRNTKTSYSSYVSSKNGPRYSSTQNLKKPVSNYISQKYSSFSSHHSSPLNQSANQDAENTKKKSSLKEILRAKRQNAAQTNFNGPSVTNPIVNANKSQTGFYSYNPTQVLMSTQSSGIKNSPSPGHYAGTIQSPQTKYFSYTNQLHHPQQSAQYGNYTSSVTSNSPQNIQYHSTVQAPYHSPVYGMHHSYQNSSFKQNKLHY